MYLAHSAVELPQKKRGSDIHIHRDHVHHIHLIQMRIHP